MSAIETSSEQDHAHWAAGSYFLAALVAAIATGILALIASGYVAVMVVVVYVGAAVVSVLVLIGAIAKGVAAGIRAARDE